MVLFPEGEEKLIFLLISNNIQPVSTPLIKGTTQYDFQNGEYLYRDIFVTGEGNFAGQEVICRGNSPIWTMVYCGAVDQGGMSDFLHISGAKENIGISKDDIFNFLRKALYKNSEEVRFGFPGRRIYQEEKWSYSEIGKKDFRDPPKDRSLVWEYAGGEWRLSV